MSKPPAPLDVRVLDAFTDLGGRGGSEPVEFLGAWFPQSFTVGLVLEDKQRDSGKVWSVRFEVLFEQGEPGFSEFTLRGLGIRRSAVEGRIRYVQAFEWEQRFDTEPLQLWQFRYVAENVPKLQRVALALAARGLSHHRSEGFPELVTWGTGGVHVVGEPLSVSEGRSDFDKQFRKWKGRTLQEREKLQEVARVYLLEVEEAHLEARRARTSERLQEHFGRPRTTTDRWVKQAETAGLLPATSRGKARTPKSTKGGSNGSEAR